MTYSDGGYGGSGYNSSNGYSADGYGAEAASSLGAGDTPWQRDLYSDGYRENPFAVDFNDTPYTETAANPTGVNTGYYHGNGYDDSSYDEQLEL